MIRHGITAIYLIATLTACGGSSHGPWSSDDNDGSVPGTPTQLAGNAGDGAVSLGWIAPEESSSSLSYNITITPETTSATITRDSTHALIRGLTNDTSYTFSVTAKNNAGESTAATILLKPTELATDISDLDEVVSDGTDLNNTNGIYDPSLLNVSGKLWMAYSSVNYYQELGHRAQDVSTSLAYSDNGGTSFTFLKTIAEAKQNVTVTPGSAANPCGNVTCTGHWVYEVPFLVDDKTDPDSSKRFKLFAHKYFLYPAASTPALSTRYALGAIVMWTAPSPEDDWSSERVILGWNSTPPELATTNNINTLNSALAECVTLSEGSAAPYQENLDFVFACSNGTTQKIVLLRSTDHANTFKYVSTPLEAADAATFNNAVYFSAPALIPTETSAPVLLATPVINRNVNINGTTATGNFYSGCIAFPLADEETGKVFRSGSAPLSILQIGFQANHLNGACTWDIGASSGILMNDGDPLPSTPQFTILKTAKSF